MSACPSVYQLRKALQVYAKSSSSKNMEQWNAFPWLYKQFSTLARVLSWFGASRFSWWKKTYVLPILRAEATPFIDQFHQGNYSAIDRYAFADVCDFFEHHESMGAVVSKKNLQPDEKKIKKTGIADKNERKKKLLEQEQFSNNAVLEIPPISRNVVEKLDTMYEHIFKLEATLAKLVQESSEVLAQIRPIKDEVVDLYESVSYIKTSLVNMLRIYELEIPSKQVFLSCSEIAIRGALLQLENLVLQTEKNIKIFSAQLSVVHQELSVINERFFDLCRMLTKNLDSVPILLPGAQYKTIQHRAMKEARECIKTMRNQFQKNTSLGLSVADFQKKILSLAAFSRQCYEEGSHRLLH